MTQSVQPQSRQQTLQQQRAADAWAKVKSVGDNTEYKQYARDLPSKILRDGIGQALAFTQAKGRQQHQLVYQHLSNWICSQKSFQPNSEDVLQLLFDANTSATKYRQIQTEALAYLQWLKRFSEASMGD